MDDLPGRGGRGVSKSQTVLRTLCVRAHFKNRSHDRKRSATVRAMFKIEVRDALQ